VEDRRAANWRLEEPCSPAALFLALCCSGIVPYGQVFLGRQGLAGQTTTHTRGWEDIGGSNNCSMGMGAKNYGRGSLYADAWCTSVEESGANMQPDGAWRRQWRGRDAWWALFFSRLLPTCTVHRTRQRKRKRKSTGKEL